MRSNSTVTTAPAHPKTYEYEPPTNGKLKSYRVRSVVPRTCAFCVHLINVTNEFNEEIGIGHCERPDGPSFDYSEMEQFSHGCKGFMGL